MRAEPPPYRPMMPEDQQEVLRRWHEAAYDEMRQRGEVRLSRQVFAVVLLATIVATGCEHSPTNPSAASACPSGVVSKGSMSAQIDGVSWAATCVIQAANAARFGYIDVAGQDGTQALSLRVHAGGPTDPLGTVLLTPGTYEIGGQPSIYGGDSYVLLSNICDPRQANCALWEAQPKFGTGAVTITALTGTNAAGTFSFSVLPVSASGATTTRAIANGVFNVTF